MAMYIDRDATRAIGRARGDLEREVARMRNEGVLQATAMQYGPGGASDRELAQRSDVARMQYGPDSAAMISAKAEDVLRRAQAADLGEESLTKRTFRPYMERMAQRSEGYDKARLPYDLMGKYMDFAAGYQGLYGVLPPREGGFPKISEKVGLPGTVAKPVINANYAPWYRKGLQEGKKPGAFTTPQEEMDETGSRFVNRVARWRYGF